MIDALERIDAAAVRHLLSVGYECAQLDYKLTVDFSFKNCRKRQALKLIKDIVAMANTGGGFIVFGVKDGSDGTFKAVGLQPGETKILTTERLESWLGKYIEPSLKVACVTTTVDGRHFTVVRVEKNRVLVPFKHAGRFTDEKGKERQIFAEGEIAVRRGASNRRVTYLDLLHFYERTKEEERQKTLAEINARRPEELPPVHGLQSVASTRDLVI